MIGRASNKSRALRDAREHAEGRYFQYEREVKEALERAYERSRTGDYAEAANVLTAGASSLTALVGVSRELALLYRMTEEGN